MSQYQNAVFTAPVYLRPLMGYTFDLVTDPATPPAPGSGSPAGAVTPLFRRNFSTGRYANMQALAASFSHNGLVLTHRTLNSALAFPNSGGAQVFKDDDIQQAFLNAGEQALPSPTTNSCVLYWLSTAGGFVPHAILIDAIEPLWRYRSEPQLTSPISTDPSFKIVTIEQAPSLQVTEGHSSPDSPAFGSLIVSPGGARTVAMFTAGFSPPAAGTFVSLELFRPASSIYGNPDETAAIFELLVMPHAPWEDDHV